MAGHGAATRSLTIPALLAGAMTLSSCGLFESKPPAAPPAAAEDVMANYVRARRARPNVHAWQAARNTLTFLKLRTSDYYGGVLATDWYRPKSSPNERLRVTVAIMTENLTPQTIRVSVLKQRLSSGEWRDVPVSKATVAAIRDRIYKAALKRQAEAVR